MEMEYINENTIRVFIETEDLLERGISFMDIMSNQHDVERFFMTVLEEVDVSKKFQHTEAITFQVMPKRNGIDLYISKGFGEGNDEEDAFQQLMDTISELEDEDSAAKENVEKIKDFSEGQEATAEPKDNLDGIDWSNPFLENKKVEKKITVVFHILEDFIAFARDFKDQHTQVDLYLYNDLYFALIAFDADELSNKEIEVLSYLAQEYGELSTLDGGLIRERGLEIAKGNASEQIRSAFQK
ncbi:adapter protein MecA [Aerococcus agrisoli]|uniref:Adapter protein MecA n=1 Tax=Aerococcus agrisoli TaxID=2487350 RepID=A0A3N4GQI1_9LACT|nr:adaptor protein MecA [Aerococcus agrisoli]RPA60870.1 adapter protein MecA [Aerococcus agrisoli]